jgi:hypothetical protein
MFKTKRPLRGLWRSCGRAVSRKPDPGNRQLVLREAHCVTGAAFGLCGGGRQGRIDVG